MRMKLKHLVILILVNCSHDAAKAESNTLSMDRVSSDLTETVAGKAYDRVTTISSVCLYLRQLPYDTNTDTLLDKVIILESQIKNGDKKISKSDYVKSVRLKSKLILLRQQQQDKYSLRVIP